ncbi:AaceriAGL014Cp [[Ashbya] aceris (nom. inval.)]|nr:AaceriAGL014Cp [[Ashbya] aceris (nom. inval.)]
MDADKVAQELELEDRLSKIRAQSNSKLDNQKHVAIILSAVEEAMGEQKDGAGNVVNYLIAFMSLLDQSVSQDTRELQDVQLAASSCYLLDIVFQNTPKPLLRSKFSELLMKIAPCITDSKTTAPLVRSAVGCLESLLVAQDAQTWQNTQGLSVSPVRGLNGLLELSLDSRAKVRKRAQEAIVRILQNPPPAPTSAHVAAPVIADFAIKALVSAIDEANNISNKKLRAIGGSDTLNARTIHILRLIASITSTNQWPTVLTEQLCDLLLEISKSSNQYLVSEAFGCFEALFNSMAESSANSGLADDKFLNVLDIIFSMKPSKSDAHLAVAWIAVVAKGVSTYASHQPLKCLLKIPDVFNVISFYLASETSEVYFSASQCLIAILTDAIKDELLLYPPQVDAETFEAVDDVISKLAEIFTGFLSINFTHCAKEVLNTLAAAFKKLKHRCNPDFLRPLEIVGAWRTNEEQFLDFRNEAEQVIGAAIEAMGPETVLGCLPLNIENPSDNRPGRAWLIPLIRDHTKNSLLSIFAKEFIPTIRHFESTIEKLDKESIQCKLFQTVVDQLWSTFPQFCCLPKDLRDVFTDDFAAELASLLYSRIELRTVICNGLKLLVTSNVLYKDGAYKDDIIMAQQFPLTEAEKNIEYLSQKSPNMLAVLFNVYTQTAPNARSYILETIEAYLKITSAENLSKTFDNVCALLKDAMDKEASSQPVKGQPKMSATLLDLVVVMSRVVPESSYTALFSIFNTTVNSQDVLTQKRAYRIISNVAELEDGSEAVRSYISDIENVMIAAAKTVQTASKAARLTAIMALIKLLPFDHHNFIVQIVPEVIVSCKDTNEKSREAAFGTLIAMGKLMNEGSGVIKLSQLPGYDPATPDQPSSVAEFFKIISAGLIGESQHMVSATITAYSCLVFEFKDEVDPQVLLEIYDTIELYLTSNSREIVKSTIGFCKVCCLSLSDEFMRPRIPSLLPKLLRWSHEHTGHFKAKIKNILERLIRRFGYDFIDANFPEEDRKLLTNIRKTRNRNKRKAAEEDQNAASSTVQSSQKSSRFMSAFDEAIYDSDEEEGNDSEEHENTKAKQYIVESKDDPLDLLDSGALAHVSSTRPKKMNKEDKRKKLASDVYSFDSEGKLVVKNETGEAAEETLESLTSGINAYLDAVKNGPIKGQKGRLKYKKGRRDNADDSDDEGAPLPKATGPQRHNRVGKKGIHKNKRKL